MHFYRVTYQLIFFWLFLLTACSNNSKVDPHFHFTKMPAAETGIAFNNYISEDDSINVFTNEYMYNGAGVGIGDFNNDGLQDVFFCGSMVSSKLYINKGNLSFEDITEKAGVAARTDGWKTGVTLADVNADGWLDIFVCGVGNYKSYKGYNQLFINNGNLIKASEIAN